MRQVAPTGVQLTAESYNIPCLKVHINPTCRGLGLAPFMPPLPIVILTVPYTHGTVFWPAGTVRAVYTVMTVFIEDTVVVGPLVGVEIAFIILVALNNAVLEVQVVK